MTELMYDGIGALAAGIARDFPNAAKVAGYVNGSCAWSAADWDLFPHAEKVTISVTASADEGDVLDVETGDARPDQTEGWIAMRKAAGLERPTIYCNLATVPAVRQGTGKWILDKDYDLWIADWDGTTAIPYPHAAAKQEKSTAGYDVSVVYDVAWPHRTPPQPVTSLLPAPASMSATPWMFIDASWPPVPGAKGYQWEVAQDGKVVVHGYASGTNFRTASLKPGAYEWRVQADGGEWTGWRAVG